MDLLVPHRCHRGQDHEQGVAEVPAQQHHVADHPIAKDQGEDQKRELETLQRVDWLWLDRRFGFVPGWLRIRHHPSTAGESRRTQEDCWSVSASRRQRRVAAGLRPACSPLKLTGRGANRDDKRRSTTPWEGVTETARDRQRACLTGRSARVGRKRRDERLPAGGVRGTQPAGDSD